MMNLETNKPIQFYSANTRINVAQKAIVGETTYYRTATAKEKNLNWAFKATDFGLPNEKAPLAPVIPEHTFFSKNSISPKKQKLNQKTITSKSGEKWWKKLFKKTKYDILKKQ